MKFPTQHKGVTLMENGRKVKYTLHRDGNTVWAGVGNPGGTITAVFKRAFDTVREAKYWMQNPSVR